MPDLQNIRVRAVQQVPFADLADGSLACGLRGIPGYVSQALVPCVFTVGNLVLVLDWSDAWHTQRMQSAYNLAYPPPPPHPTQSNETLESAQTLVASLNLTVNSLKDILERETYSYCQHV
jgi:hypothetical protein